MFPFVPIVNKLHTVNFKRVHTLARGASYESPVENIRNQHPKKRGRNCDDDNPQNDEPREIRGQNQNPQIRRDCKDERKKPCKPLVAEKIECEQEQIEYVLEKCKEYSCNYYEDFKYSVMNRGDGWLITVATILN